MHKILLPLALLLMQEPVANFMHKLATDSRGRDRSIHVTLRASLTAAFMSWTGLCKTREDTALSSVSKSVEVQVPPRLCVLEWECERSWPELGPPLSVNGDEWVGTPRRTR